MLSERYVNLENQTAAAAACSRLMQPVGIERTSPVPFLT
jgi:hypothetical protein